jgi:hypothetical protein
LESSLLLERSIEIATEMRRLSVIISDRDTTATFCSKAHSAKLKSGRPIVTPVLHLSVSAIQEAASGDEESAAEAGGYANRTEKGAAYPDCVDGLQPYLTGGNPINPAF